MSVSAFHRQFKAVTNMSPLKFQKTIRLMHARRLMITEALSAASVSVRVGYESPSQFSREYSRLFGQSPARDTAELAGTGATALEGRRSLSANFRFPRGLQCPLLARSGH